MTYNNINNFSSLFDLLFETPKVSNAEKFGVSSLDTDIEKAENGYKMIIEVPGVKKEDVSIDYKEGYLNLRVASSTVKVIDGKTETEFVHRERFSGTASRSYFVGEIDEKLIRASMADGLLTIFVPNEKKDEPEVHQIAIN